MVIEECSNAIGCNGRYVKAFHRRSKAYHTLGFLEQSLEDITMVCVLEEYRSRNAIEFADKVLKELGNSFF